ncbi:zinc ribbon domain-containing protein [Acidianus manzaensis]|uniref:Zinc-ribbon domain-containing protein n=1 Tax=Acidianus manzaensis TaxID=282676 RepID=A0A1W6K382_9CREN|nr:zinc ribbon domain-containing protein [Acidianus manzaensis]ARM76945.1 hypothetical protein B6F84_13590 [Acidianus manzaensis]
MSIICPYCGYANPDEALYCMRCGARLNPGSFTGTFQQPYTQQDNLPKEMFDINNQMQGDISKPYESVKSFITRKKTIVKIMSNQVIRDGYINLKIESFVPAVITSAYIQNPYIPATYINPNVLNPGNTDVKIYFGNRSSLVPGESYILIMALNISPGNDNVPSIKLDMPTVVKYES